MSQNPQENQPHETADIIRDQSPRGTADNNSQRGSAARRKLNIPSEEQCLSALTQIPVLMMTGMMSTAQANVAKAVYTAALQHYRQPKSTSNNPISAPSLIDILKDQPSMFDSLAAMFTPEQLKDFQKRVNDANEAA